VVAVLVMLSLDTFLILLLHTQMNGWLTVVAVLVMLLLDTFLILLLHRGTAG
jgi:hypothetical protein